MLFQVTIKGRDIAELKSAADDLCKELHCGGIVKSAKVEKVLETSSIDKSENTMLQAVSPSLLEDVSAPIVTGVELDAEGIPWDSRIHASSGKKVKAGTWTMKRNVEDAFVVQVKEELKAQVKRLSNPPQIPEAPITALTPVVETPIVSVQPIAEVTPPAASVLPTPMMNNSGHTFETFKTNFAIIVGKLITEGKLSAEYVQTLNNYFGVTEIWSINDLQKQELFEGFAASGFIQKVG